jgi:D-glycero-D-manno-heptose 1,7-bisphosphate phosphatase
MSEDGRPAVFVDRDKTLIEDPGYIKSPEQIRLLPGAAEAVARLRAAGYPVVVVTNQSGIARGYFTEDELTLIHRRLQELLNRHGSGVDAIYYCPYLAGDDAVVERYRRDSDLRKPKPGMLLMAAKEMELDTQSSWMVGDSIRDAEAGKAAGCRTILIGYEGEVASEDVDMTAESFAAAADIILNETRARTGVDTTEEHPVASETAAPLGGDHRHETVGAHTSTTAEGDLAGIKSTLDQILDEQRAARRDAQYSDFSIAHLAGSIAQAFAFCAIGWGLYELIDGSLSQATSRLLLGIAFQLMALTGFVAGKRG